MTQRYLSLDIFRGATVAFMILVNNPGSWSNIFSPLRHAKWHGVTPTDLVFPFFLFAVGNAMAFVMPRLQQGGDTQFWKKVITRTSLIFLIGIFLNWFPFVTWVNNVLIVKGWTWINNSGELSGIRILGVLQRIALCYFFASIIIYYAKPKGSFYWSIFMLLLYWVLCYVGNPTDPYSLEGWFGTDVDKSILGEVHMYHGEGIAFDPEGIVSTLPAIVEVIFGYLVGHYLLQQGQRTAAGSSATQDYHPLYKTLTILLVTAVVLMFLAYAWDISFPINKKIWTSSYVLITCGFAIALLSVLVYVVEVLNRRGAWTKFFEVFGKNPLFIYALSGLIPKFLGIIHISNGVDEAGKEQFISPWGWFHQNITAKFPGPPEAGSFLFAITFVLLLWSIAYWMDKKKVYIRV